MSQQLLYGRILIGSIAALVTIAVASPAIGLFLGIVCALALRPLTGPLPPFLSKYLLQAAVVLLGFGIGIGTIVQVGSASLLITGAGITLTMMLGWLLGRLLSLEDDITTLISSGTAICGGSAIAAVAPAIGARQAALASSLAIVFSLNAIGLLIFPPLAETFGLSQEQFGLWAALAIHDTSSVVGAAAIYGAAALAIATTVKLTRALWILPLSLGLAAVRNTGSGAKYPWFLLGFLAAALINSTWPAADYWWSALAFGGKRLMVTTLFLIGFGLSLAELREIGLRPLALAIILWLLVSLGSLLLIQTDLLTLPAAASVAN